MRKDFFDTDEDIERVSGMSVGRIFSVYGEVRFRSEEALAAKRASKLQNTVIATGGGIVINRENMDLLSKNAIIIALKADPKEIQRRVSKRNSFRPLLGSDRSLKRIKELMLEREGMYNRADHVIDTTGKDLDEVLAEAFQIVRNNA